MTRAFSAAIVVLTLMAGPVDAQNNANEPGITRSQADAILNELKQIRQLLERQPANTAPTPAPTTGKLSINGGYSLGPKDAAATMVEFTDYECPFCRQFESTTFSEIRKKYIDTGKLQLVVRNMPLSAIHPNAMRAAQAALCADDQGQFWGMHDLLFSSAENLAGEGIIQSARKLPMDVSAFRSCLDGGKHIPDVLKDIQDATSLQFNGTPSFLIGRTTADGVEGSILMGAQPFSVFDARLGQVIAGH